jgi:hypothetical protein
VPDSWRLKVDRAEQHLGELRLGIGEYVQKHPYEMVRIVGVRNCRQVHPGLDCGGSWTLRIKEQPNPALSIIAGDVVHNLRSALDHLAVTLVPSARRGSASFPIETRDIWAKNGRRYIVRDAEARKRWRTAINGMAPETIAVLKQLQPYGVARPNGHLLAVLSRLDNADKHRQLILFTVGLTKVTGWGEARGRVTELRVQRPDAFVVDDGAELFHFAGRGPGGRLRYDEVDVKVRGAPLVTIKTASEGRRKVQEFQPIGQFFETAIQGMREVIFPGLEPHVRR